MKQAFCLAFAGMRLSAPALFLLLSLLVAASPAAGDSDRKTPRTLEGGIQIWTNGNWSLIRADVGPRWTFDEWLSVRPHGSIGPAFLPNISGAPLSLGAYLDVDASITVGDRKAIQIGPGGGVSTITGLFDVTGVVFPNAFAQAAFRWDENLIGLMAIWGQQYDYDSVLNIGGPEKIRFSGIGLRFEYVVD